MLMIETFSVTKDRNENINFNIKIQNGPIRSHLTYGIVIETTDGSYSDWPMFSTVKDPDSENWSDPNEIVVDKTITFTANQKGWANGLYNAWAYVWECEGEPGSWKTIEPELDSKYIANAFEIIPELPSNVDNISDISHNIEQGKCLPGVLFSWTTDEKTDAFVIRNGEWKMKYPTREVLYDDYDNQNEMIANMITFYNFGSNYNTTVDFYWYRESDDTMVYHGTFTIPSANSQGYEYWVWGSFISWIGKCSWEISGKGIYRCEIIPSGGPLSGNATLYFRIK